MLWLVRRYFFELHSHFIYYVVEFYNTGSISILLFKQCNDCYKKKKKKFKKFGRNPKSDRDWKDRKKIEMSQNVLNRNISEMFRNVSKCLEKSGNVSKCLEMSRNKSPNKKGIERSN